MTDQPRHHGSGHQPRDHGIAHHPRYHGTDEGAVAGAGEPRTARQRRMLVLVIAIVIALVLAVVIMHLTGAMPKGTGF